jgi:hypothetical protein
MDPAASPSRAGRSLRPLRRVVLAALAGAAWLTLSGTAAQADEGCTIYGPAGDEHGTVAAAECAGADDFPVPALEGSQVPLESGPAPSGTWAAGAVPALVVASADASPAVASKDVADDARVASDEAAKGAAGIAVRNAAPVPDAPPPAADPGPPASDPAVSDPSPAPGAAPPSTSPAADPAVPAVDPTVPGTGVVSPAVDPAAPSTGAVPPVVVPAAPVDPAPLQPGDSAAVVPGVLPGAVVPGDGTAAATPAAVVGASPPADSAKAASQEQPAPAAPAGPPTPGPLPTYRPAVAPVTYAGLLMSEPVSAAPVQSAAAPPAEPPAGTGGPPASPGTPGPSPWHGGTGLPAPDALPAAPGSGCGSGQSSNGPAGTAAWMPGLYFCLPTTGADPITGPLQHEYAAVSADPGSSPD